MESYFSFMKIRRIDQHDVLQHARNFQKRSHRATTSELHQYPEFSIFNKSERSSVDFKIIKEKLILRKQRKNKTFVENEQALKIMAIYEKIKFLYKKLSLLYTTNENKLTSLLVRHIKVEYYLFSKQILELIRNFRLNKENLTICYHAQSTKIIHELTKFKQFLQNFYERKCLKQIQIIQDNIVQRQEAIRYSTPVDRYKMITKSFRPALITNNINIMEEFKQMSVQSGSFKQLSRVQCSLYKKLRQTQSKISKVFISVCNMKEKDQFMCKIEDFEA